MAKAAAEDASTAPAPARETLIATALPAAMPATPASAARRPELNAIRRSLPRRAPE
jgi:hypothetical protein